MAPISQISLLAAFIAGMVALFAPCCISYLLPAYLGNIFRLRRQIIFMTLVYSLGIFIVILPVVLGAKILANFFLNFHDQTYFLGGLFLILVSFLSLFGIKLPMISLPQPSAKPAPDFFSTLTLGIFSGITSACCAPVLIGVLTLGSLTPSLIQALLVGVAYVLGMVAPLFFTSFFIHRFNLLNRPFFKHRLAAFSLAGRSYPIFVSNLIAFFVFLITGVLLISLNFAGRLAMPSDQSPSTKFITQTAFFVTDLINRFSWINLIFVSLIVYFLFRLFQKR